MMRISSYFLAGILGVIGCSSITEQSSKEKEKIGEKSEKIVYLEGKARVALDGIIYITDLGREIQTHDSEGEIMNLKVIGDMTLPRLGTEGSLGTERIRGKIGGDARFNLISSLAYKNNPTFNSDRKTVPGDRAVFTQLTQDYFTLIPFLGIEGKVKRNLTLGIEVGFPYNRFKALTALEEFGGFSETEKKDSWHGFGISVKGLIGVAEGDRSFSFSIGYEGYKAKFEGEKASINGIVLGLEFGYKF